MAAACRELTRRGHSVHAVSVAGSHADTTRAGWALSA